MTSVGCQAGLQRRPARFGRPALPGEELRPWRGAHSRDRAVFAKRYPFRKMRRAHFRVELLVVGSVERFRPDADL